LRLGAEVQAEIYQAAAFRGGEPVRRPLDRLLDGDGTALAQNAGWHLAIPEPGPTHRTDRSHVNDVVLHHSDGHVIAAAATTEAGYVLD
jgi:hypothetical protein